MSWIPSCLFCFLHPGSEFCGPVSFPELVGRCSRVACRLHSGINACITIIRITCPHKGEAKVLVHINVMVCSIIRRQDIIIFGHIFGNAGLPVSANCSTFQCSCSGGLAGKRAGFLRHTCQIVGLFCTAGVRVIHIKLAEDFGLIRYNVELMR